MGSVSKKPSYLDQPPQMSLWWQGPLLAACYFGLAKLGLHFTVVADSVTLIWPPSGVALFALLVFGVKLWPWIFLGAFVTNLTTGIPAQACAVIGLGNMLEAVAGFYLLRLTGFNRKLPGVRDIMLLILLAAGLSTMIAASVGSYILAGFQIIPAAQIGDAWLSWWMGDAMGVLIFAPLLLAWRFGGTKSPARLQLAEVVLLVLCLFVVTNFVFGTQLDLFDRPRPLAFMIFPLLIWAAIRFGMRGATTAVSLVAALTLGNIVDGHGLFAQGSSLESLTLVWLYANFLAVTSMVLAASVNERLMAEEKMSHLALHDALTGLPNRVSLQDDLCGALARAARHDRQVAVLFMDLDRFKKINDSLGHTVGDQLLIDVGRRLSHSVRDSDSVVRHGGDEFVVLLEDIEHGEHAGRIGEKIAKAMHQPFYIQGATLYTSVSIGISIYPADGSDVDTLLKHADIAMYRAKDLGRNNVTFYSPDMNQRAVERLAMENQLRLALEREEYALYYQPQYDSMGLQVQGCEALLRWRKPGGGLVAPDDFIPLLEETGLIRPVGAWVIETACEQLSNWHSLGWSSPRMSVNISSHQLDDQELPALVCDSLARHGLSPEWLELEITESMLVRHDPVTSENLRKLADLGVRLAIDDFGTGYSSLSYLHRLSIDTLKIDRSFVKELPGNGDSESIARAIIGLGKSMRLDLVAEGVESAAQAEFLRELGCDLLQGYLYSMPVTATEFLSLLRLPCKQAVGA